MRRTVTIIPPAGMAAVIYDGNKSPRPDNCPDGFKPVPADQVQTTPLFRAAFQFMADRANIIVKWDFTVWHNFATQQACQDFFGERPFVLPRAGELMIVTRSATGQYTRYYKTAIVHAPVLQTDLGLACLIRYSILMNSAYSLTP